ncbi:MULTISPECIES: DUF2845 domain-containing protein [Pseudomonas]|uniref:DUF2845 domain-containing protein n=1 Tax=Pseudomonas kuykendallii TaxID=1007099 RepID=A0A2W5CP73_9PSED|nr:MULTISPECIES: DUF2845 domain-containing protein [Pseudomonas]MCQ4271782.1 DUF2845 domain-containing protein [Pseudomonas kuykendallii]PZP21485.1 MAG: DUF2845 domain-containing protein [Pseudomonas kuykendallii]SDW06409.1 Protein of unknown function [Pseudomonas kuykendallii]
MTYRLLALLCLLPLAAQTQASSSFRCGNALVTTDDHMAEVAGKCGDPVSRDFLGYRERTDDYGYRNEVQVEEWLYGPRNGMYYYLRFEGNRLVNVDSKRN